MMQMEKELQELMILRIMGRHKNSTGLKVLRGTNQPCRDVSTQDLRPLEFVPKPPKELSRDVKKIFAAKAAQLVMLRVLTELDIDELIIYATSLATVAEAEKHLIEEGRVILIKDEDGNILSQEINVWNKIYKDNVAIVNSIGVKFGFSPASRASILSSIPKREKKDEFDDF